MNRGKRAPASVFGGPTVLTVLLVLLFALFSLLALSRAQTAWTVAARTAETARTYYEAAGKGEAVLAGLAAAREQPAAARGALAVNLAAEQGAEEAAYDEASRTLSARFGAGAQGKYLLRVRLEPAETGGTAYTVLAGRVEPDDPADTDTALPVYQ